MPKRLKKISEETVHENKWWVCKHDRYTKPNGEEGDYFYGETNGMVMVVPVLPDGRIVMVLQYRYLQDKQSIEFPGGGIQVGTETAEAAKLELAEETGCVGDDYIQVGKFESSSGLIKDTAYVFTCQVEEQGLQHLDDTEDMEVIYRRPDEIEEMILRNDIWDGQTLAAWSLVRHHFIKPIN